jgi:hypothetical protein
LATTTTPQTKLCGTLLFVTVSFCNKPLFNVGQWQRMSNYTIVMNEYWTLSALWCLSLETVQMNHQHQGECVTVRFRAHQNNMFLKEQVSCLGVKKPCSVRLLPLSSLLMVQG